MKYLLIKSVAVMLLIFIFSCSKDDSQPQPIVYQEENPLPEFLTKANFSLTEPVFFGGGFQEQGLVFTPYSKGNFNAFVVKLPVAEGFVKVNLWDVAAKTIIISENINVSEANKDFIKRINPIALQNGKNYLITIRSKNGYNHQNGIMHFPVTVGNNLVIKSFTFSGISYSYDDAPVYPDFETNYNGIYYGDVSFLFQQTE